MSALKVYDSDFVGENGEYLRELARDLVMDYTGNWEELIAVKRCLVAGVRLNNIEARRALNMVTSASCEPGILAVVRDALDRNGPTLAPRKNPPPPRLRVVRERSRKIDVPTKTKVKFTYLRPARWNGVVHVVNASYTIIEWHAPYEQQAFSDGGDYDFEHRIPFLRAEVMCGKQYQMGRRGFGTNLELYKSAQDVPNQYKRCAGCAGAVALP
jgi:hypothetical protein